MSKIQKKLDMLLAPPATLISINMHMKDIS